MVKVKLPRLFAKAGSTVSVPVVLTYFSKVGAVSLTIYFNSGEMKFVGISKNIATGVFNATFPPEANEKGRINISWYDVKGLKSGSLCTLRFSFTGGQQDLILEKGVASSFADYQRGENLEATYIDGSITQK